VEAAALELVSHVTQKPVYLEHTPSGLKRSYVVKPGDELDTIPGTARPHHSLVKYFRWNLLEEIGMDGYWIIGLARLETDDEIRSGPIGPYGRAPGGR
jgi:hypothetical protein